MSKSDGDSSSLSKNWELNIYELNRIPHEIIYDDTEIAVSPKILQNELMCPICLDILKSTMTTKECLHRFCHDCIITALRAGNKECPTCRKKLVSKRSLRPDPNFDGIIAKIYPNREEYDALHEKVLEKLNKKHLNAISSAHNNSTNSNSHKSSRGRVNQHNNNHINSNNNNAHASAEHQNDVNMEISHNNNDQAASSSTAAVAVAATATTSNSNNDSTPHQHSNNRNHKRHTTTHSDDSDMESRASTEQSSLHLPNDLDEIELVLKPHPLKEITLNSNRFLKTTSNATMNHLSKYLWTRLCVEPPVTQANGSSALPTAIPPSSLVASSNLTTTNCTENDFQIFICLNEKLPNSYQLLNQSLTLEQIMDKHWKLNRPVELFYYLKSNASSDRSNDQLNGICNNSNSNSSSISSNSSSSGSY